MPDVGIPGAEFIYGKKPNDIGKLISNISDAALAAKQLKLLYTTGELAEILGSGYMTVNRAVDILTDAGFTVATAGSVMDNSACGDGRNADILAEMSVAEAVAQLNHTNLTVARIDTSLNQETAQATILRERWADSGCTRHFHIWVVTTDLNTAVYAHAGAGDGVGDIYHISFGGSDSARVIHSEMEYYNVGTNHGVWAIEAAWEMNSPIHYHAGSGKHTNAISCGGNTAIEGLSFVYTAETEEGRGVWVISGVGDLSAARAEHACAGDADAAIAFGGAIVGDVVVKTTEKYNGSVWASTDDLTNVCKKHAGCGTAAAGLGVGVYGVGSSPETEEYNGSVWATGGLLNIGTSLHGVFGSQNSAVSCGGTGAATITDETEEYNGAAWSVSGIGDLQAAVKYHSVGGQSTSGGLSFGGSPGSGVTPATEEYI